MAHPAQPNDPRDTVAAFRGLRAVVVGDVMLDEYVWGDVRRISPEAPVPVVETRRRSESPGGAGNVAANIAALGGVPLLCGVVGEDAPAAAMARALAACGVTERELLVAPGRPTTVKSRVIAHSQQMLRLDTETSAPIGTGLEDAVIGWCCEQLADAQVCVLSDYAKGVLTPRVCRELIACARQRGVPVVVDPKGRAYERYAGATAVTPNAAELAVAVGRLPGAAQDVPADAETVLAQLGGAALLVTRGAEGMSLFRDGAAPLHIAARARTVFDVTGAGDTVVAVLALALATGAPLPLAAPLANEAAGLAVSRVGTVAVTGEELLAAVGGRW